MFGTEFYPTPKFVIHKMLNKISLDACYFLEQNIGKGDIAEAIVEKSFVCSSGDGLFGKFKNYHLLQQFNQRKSGIFYDLLSVFHICFRGIPHRSFFMKIF